MQKQEILRIFYLYGTIRGVNSDQSQIDVYYNNYVLERYDLANQCGIDWIDDFYSNDFYSFDQKSFEKILDSKWESTDMRCDTEVTTFDLAEGPEAIMKEWPDYRVLNMWDKIKSSFPKATERSHFEIEEVIIRSEKEKQGFSKKQGQGLSSILGPMKRMNKNS